MITIYIPEDSESCFCDTVILDVAFRCSLKSSLQAQKVCMRITMVMYDGPEQVMAS